MYNLLNNLVRARGNLDRIEGIYHHALSSTYQYKKSKTRTKASGTYSMIKELGSSIKDIIDKVSILKKLPKETDKEINDLFKK